MTSSLGRGRADPGPTHFEVPSAIPELGAAVPGLAVAGLTGSRPFLIEGKLASATGMLKGGFERITIRDRAVVHDLSVGGSLAVNFVLMPGALRRERIGPRGTVLENAIIAPTLPLVAVQWSASPMADDDALRLTVPGRGTPIRPSVHGGVLHVTGQDEDESVVIALVGGAGAWSVVDDGSGGLRVSHRVAGEGRPTLLVTAGTEAVVRSTLAAAAHLLVHERRAVGSTVDGARVVTGVTELDDGIAWGSGRVRASLSQGAARHHGEASAEGHTVAASHNAFWSGLGAIAGGDFEGARRAAALLERCPDPGGASQHAWPVAAMATLLAARLALASGDTSLAQRRARSILDGDRVAPGLSASTRGLWTLAFEALADASRYTESVAHVADLRGLAAAPAPEAAGGRRLPMVGDAEPQPESDAGAFLRSVLVGARDRVRAPTTGSPTLDDALRGWSEFNSDVDGAWVRWRQRLSDGLASGPVGPATWDRLDEGVAGGAPLTGVLIAAFFHGVLGYAPDAPSGRLRLAPRLPAHMSALDVQGLRLSSTELALRYERSGTHHRFVIEPTSGRVPPMLIFEPSVLGSRLAEAYIESAPADLEATCEGDRVRIRVQLPLDAQRTIEFRTE